MTRSDAIQCYCRQVEHWIDLPKKRRRELLSGLRRELELDRLNGFTGKTAVHPTQLPIICQTMQVSAEDYEDARSILGWSAGDYGVAKSAGGSRMNEVKCHAKWAEHVCKLAAVYGIREEEP